MSRTGSELPAADRHAGPALQRLKSPLACLVAGVAHAGSFAPTQAWWLQILSMAWLAWAVSGASVRGAALRGWLFATAWLCAGLWWLYISMHDFGSLPPWLAALAVAVLSAALALYYALALAVWARWRGALGPLLSGLLWAACWLLAELARGVLFTGFPWIASGYAHAVGPLAAWAPWIGVYGLCALAALLAWALAALAQPEPMRGRTAPLAWAAALVLLGQVLPGEFTRTAGVLQVSLLQPNVPQNLKFDPDRLGENLRQLVSQVGQARGQLVVTPESVVPLARGDLGEQVWQALHGPFQGPGQVQGQSSQRGLLVGIFMGDETAGYVNSMVGLSAVPSEYVYGKRHLLPFGEFIPPGFGWLVRRMGIPLADQARGTQTAPFEVAGQRLRLLICYEDLFGEDVVDSVVGARAATVLVNASNLAWFGRWMVQDQHLQFSQMRALEFQRPVVRATNTGATAVVDHHGRVTARLPPLVQGTLEASVEGRIGTTPYATWLSRLGLWPLGLLAAAMVAAAVVSGRPARRI